MVNQKTNNNNKPEFNFSSKKNLKVKEPTYVVLL